jgi:hypothetical protein
MKRSFLPVSRSLTISTCRNGKRSFKHAYPFLIVSLRISSTYNSCPMRRARPWMHSSGCSRYIPVKSAANIDGSSHGSKRSRQPPERSSIASVGLLLSGEAFGVPTSLPWGVPLFGAMRHPTQIYFALAALSSLIVVWRLSRQPLPLGALGVAYLGLQGFTSLLIEALRADSLVLPGGIRAAQVFGLGLLLYALTWAQRHSRAASVAAAETPEPTLQEQS